MAVEVETLEGFGQDAALRRKWMKMWDTLGERILKMPEWMQNIVLEDIYTAVKNRIAIMEIIQNAKRRN
jgi:orotate phosphoribosyltransferase